MEIYDFENFPENTTNRWEKRKKQVEHSFQSWPLPRFGHSMCYHRNSQNLYIFGGETKRGVLTGGDRNPLCDLMQYNLNTEAWETIQTKNEISTRRNHIGVIFGYLLVVQGGYNSRNKILKDAWTFDLRRTGMEWEPLL